jgi:SMI1 / KNR4 family (SUKH-1)
MTSAFMDDFAKKLLVQGLVYEDRPLRGCSDAEVEEIERTTNVKLPPIYRAFLQTMGKSTGEFLRGEERCYPELLTLREGADELLAEEGATTKFKLSPTDFVFWMSQGTQFFFFDTAVGDDPPVYHFREGCVEPALKWPHYSHALSALSDQQIELLKRMNAREKKKI